MNIEIKLNQKELDKLGNKINKALEMTANDILSDLEASDTIPRDTGQLEDIKTHVFNENGEIGIVSEGPYAARLYYNPEFNFKKTENQNAGAYWFEPYINGDKQDFAAKSLSDNIKKL